MRPLPASVVASRGRAAGRIGAPTANRCWLAEAALGLQTPVWLVVKDAADVSAPISAYEGGESTSPHASRVESRSDSATGGVDKHPKRAARRVVLHAASCQNWTPALT